jgi:hypothetical protein
VIPIFLKLVEKAEMMMQERGYSSLNLLLFFGSTIWYNNNTLFRWCIALHLVDKTTPDLKESLGISKVQAN